MAEFKGKQGHLVTTESGSHIFIESGGSFDEAVEKAFGKENAKKYKKYEKEMSDEDKEEITVPFLGGIKGKIVGKNGDSVIVEFELDGKIKRGEYSQEIIDSYRNDNFFDNDNDFEKWGDEEDFDDALYNTFKKYNGDYTEIIDELNNKFPYMDDEDIERIVYTYHFRDLESDD